MKRKKRNIPSHVRGLSEQYFEFHQSHYYDSALDRWHGGDLVRSYILSNFNSLQTSCLSSLPKFFPWSARSTSSTPNRRTQFFAISLATSRTSVPPGGTLTSKCLTREALAIVTGLKRSAVIAWNRIQTLEGTSPPILFRPAVVQAAHGRNQASFHSTLCLMCGYQIHWSILRSGFFHGKMYATDYGCMHLIQNFPLHTTWSTNCKIWVFHPNQITANKGCLSSQLVPSGPKCQQFGRTLYCFFRNYYVLHKAFDDFFFWAVRKPQENLPVFEIMLSVSPSESCLNLHRKRAMSVLKTNGTPRRYGRYLLKACSTARASPCCRAHLLRLAKDMWWIHEGSIHSKVIGKYCSNTQLTMFDTRHSMSSLGLWGSQRKTRPTASTCCCIFSTSGVFLVQVIACPSSLTSSMPKLLPFSLLWPSNRILVFGSKPLRGKQVQGNYPLTFLFL